MALYGDERREMRLRLIMVRITPISNDNANFRNKERWDAQRNTTIANKLDKIIDLLQTIAEQND